MNNEFNALNLLPAIEEVGTSPQLTTSCCGSCSSSLLMASHCDDWR